MKTIKLACSLLLLCVACDDDNSPRPIPDPQQSDAGTEARAPTYWQDMMPIFDAHCLQCHQAGGIAPFRLDEYVLAKRMAPAIAASTAERSMPPWGVTDDGSCGEFAGSLALSAAQIETIAAWVAGGALEGTVEPRDPPTLPTLAGATELSTPSFVPQIQGGELAESDEYRCFELATGLSEPGFITGYEVVPGRPELVHHVLVMLVDPDAPAELDETPAVSNRALLEALDAESPDRDGWPCFGMAGDGVSVSAVPVTWAPGQGVVRYPGNSGVPLSPEQRVIVQVHYNLANGGDMGLADQTKVRLKIEPKVENVGLFVLEDPLLDSLFQGEPVTLPAGKSSAPYTWHTSIEELGLSQLPELKLYGVMPHMHQLGHKYQLRVSTEGALASCAADVQSWDFHWQRMYFYQQPIVLTERSRLEVTCDYDTSRVTTPVLPGWGTRNEMCLATLYFTVPIAALGD